MANIEVAKEWGIAMSSPFDSQLESIEIKLDRARYWFEALATLIVCSLGFGYYAAEMSFIAWLTPELIIDSNGGMLVLILAAIVPLVLVSWLQEPIRVTIIRFLRLIGKDSLTNNINFGRVMKKYNKKLEELDTK